MFFCRENGSDIGDAINSAMRPQQEAAKEGAEERYCISSNPGEGHFEGVHFLASTTSTPSRLQSTTKESMLFSSNTQ
jgi:hypothetical protein